MAESEAESGVERKDRNFVQVSLQSGDLSCTPLGVVLTEGDETLEKFKAAVTSSLISPECRFLFATSEGHYISEELSRVLTVADITEDGTVHVKKQPRDKPLFGVVAGDLAMGCFISSWDSSLPAVRVAILEQAAHRITLSKSGFLFLHNTWPISPEQESTLALFDVLDKNQVYIQFELNPPTQPAIPQQSPLDEPSMDSSRTPPPETSLATAQKRVYLSYVSDETSLHVHALQLALKRLGLKVYTDGEVGSEASSSESSDQEYVNRFIQKAAVFVPIVSSRYGETNVTNMEVKYADSLEKFTVPLNLNSHWPPNCLAIQFANVRYIQWNVTGSVDKSASAMAEGILEVMQSNQEALNAKRPKLDKRKSSAGIIKLEEKSLVVVLCHPTQEAFQSYVKELLVKKNFTVWSSLELESCSASHISSSIFQKKIADCGLVVCIVSKDFCSSVSCEQLVYYCQHRKKMIPVMYEDVEMPYWVSMLVGSEEFIDGRGSTFDDVMCKRVKLALSSSSVSVNRREEREIKRLQEELFSRLPDGNLVYISGGSHFYCSNSEAICKLLGKELAKLKSLVLVTGGHYGIGDLVAKSFYEKRKRLGHPVNLYHALGTKDPADKSRQTRQKEDGTMEPSPYGETIFLGNSVRQCNTASTRVFNICILIEGGPGSAYEVQQFAWNGAIVIPVKSTGGAAGGKFHVPSSIFRPPAGVSEPVWSVLSDETASVEDVVASLVHILEVCFKNVVSKKEPTASKKK